MITLFRNAEKDTYFFVDPTERTANHISSREVGVFKRHRKYLNLTILELPNYKTVTAFKHAIKKGILDNIPPDKYSSTLRSLYPEYFI